MKLPRKPSTPKTTAMIQVSCLGAESFMVFSFLRMNLILFLSLLAIYQHFGTYNQYSNFDS
jgi:hypothetical protein